MYRIKQFIFLSLIAINSYATGDTTYYYGVNNEPAGPENAVQRMEISRTFPNRYRFGLYAKKDDKWFISSEGAVRIKNENEYVIREYRPEKGITRKLTRWYSGTPEGMWTFAETYRDRTFRTGTSSTKFPLTLEGKEIRYYENGNVESESIYNNNQLVSNTIWLEDGSMYFEDVFYSVSEYPDYKPGTELLHKYLREYLRQSGYSMEGLSGQVRIGFVITREGKLEGVRVLEGIIPPFNEIVADAVAAIPGEWKPARLNDKAVNCYLTIPINVISVYETRFENLEVTYTNAIYMLNW